MGNSRVNVSWRDLPCTASADAEAMIPLLMTEVTASDIDCHSFCGGNNHLAGSCAVYTDLPPGAVVAAHYCSVPAPH